MDGNALLEGTQIFALELDEETTAAKVCRGFDSIASNNKFKITSKILFQLPAQKLFKAIINGSFKHSKEFKIIQVLKATKEEHAFVVASSPKQRSIILRSALAVEGELITSTVTGEKLIATEIARKNCLVLIAKNLNKGLIPG